jgi:hypothetical protein
VGLIRGGETTRGIKKKCGSQDLTLQAILSNGVATVRQTLRRIFSAMAAERAKKRRKLVLTPVYNNSKPLLRLKCLVALLPFILKNGSSCKEPHCRRSLSVSSELAIWRPICYDFAA